MTTKYCNEYIDKLTNEKWSYFDINVKNTNFFYLVFFSSIDSVKTTKILNDNSIAYSGKEYSSNNSIVNEIYVSKQDLIMSIRDKKIKEILK